MCGEKGSSFICHLAGLPFWFTHQHVFNVARSVTPDTGRLGSANHCITSYSPAIESVETWPQVGWKVGPFYFEIKLLRGPKRKWKKLLPEHCLEGRKAAAPSLLSKYINTCGLPLLGFQNEDEPMRDAGKEGNDAEWGHLPVVFLCHLSLHPPSQFYLHLFLTPIYKTQNWTASKTEARGHQQRHRHTLDISHSFLQERKRQFDKTPTF